MECTHTQTHTPLEEKKTRRRYIPAATYIEVMGMSEGERERERAFILSLAPTCTKEGMFSHRFISYQSG